MYRDWSKQGGKSQTINGITVHFPPVGKVYDPYEDKLIDVGVLKRSSIVAEQYWERIPEPEDYKERCRAEQQTQQTNPDYFDSTLQSYRNDMWDKRELGLWFMNNGEPTYITGLNFFYLNFWKIDTGYPQFRIPDCEFFWFLQYCVEDPNCLGMVEATKRRQGKCLGVNELVRMYDGSKKKAKDIIDGDLLMGDNNKPRTVVGTVRGRENMYKIVPKKGKGFTCNESHILHCIQSGTKKVINISVRDYLKLSDSAKRRLMQRKTGYDLPNQNLPVDPYFVGAWLGDGHSKSIELSNEDPEVIEYLKDFAIMNELQYHNYGENNLRHSLGRNTRVEIEGTYKGRYYKFNNKLEFMREFGFAEKSPLQTSTRTNSVYREGDWKVTKITNPVRDAFNELNLLNNKHIPDIYMRGSLEQRLRLLAGIIDTDGTYIKKGYFVVAQSKKKEELVNQIEELALSCGFSVTRKNDIHNNAIRLSISGNVWNIPTLISRKQAPKVARKYDSLVCGFTVESLGEGEYAGFELDDNHLFVLANGIVTHNTKRAGAFLYDRVTKNSNYNGGIQSKTLDDAKGNVFQKGIVQPFKHLPDFFVPVYDTSKGVNPENGFRFSAPTSRSKNAKRVLVDELESEITFKSSDVFAYDGTKQHAYVGDEVGKSKDVDVYDRHQVVRFCLELDGEIIGKALYTTTVEDMAAGGAAFKKLWNTSDPSNRNQNGRTTSGLYKYFLPAYRTLYYDKYGCPDEERAKQFYYNERKSLEDDPRALAGYIRKNPFSEEEMFWTDAETCHFDSIKINNQLESVTWINEDELHVRGDFVWVNAEKDSSVEFYPNKKGRWMLDRRVNLQEMWNRVETLGTTKKPLSTVRFVGGVDPFDHNVTVDSRRSDGACYIYGKYDAASELSETFLCQYIHRPPTSEMFYEDMIKTCHFFGCELLVEDNKIGMVNYFLARNYHNFLMKLPNSKKYGISGSLRSHQQIVEETELYIHKNIEKTLFKDLLQDWLAFDIHNTTNFDAAMAAGYALIGAGKHRILAGQRKEQKLYSYNDIFPI